MSALFRSARLLKAPTHLPRGTFAAQQQVRNLNIHEYQSQMVMEKYGVNVPPGIPAKTVEEAVEAASKLAGDEVVVKSQILAGGRGLGTFKNGFQGGVHIVKKTEVAETAKKMLGEILVTKQTGPEGKPVGTLLLAEKMALTNEMYFAILLDRSMGGPVVIGCAEGGTSIEDLAEEFPDKIIKEPIDINVGMTDAQAAKIVDTLACTTDKAAAADQIKKLYAMFRACDCSMLEVNPLGETATELVAADAKIGFDDNASFRQKDIYAMRDISQEDPRESKAAEADLNYIGLDGEIGCMVNGAGLAMATMDIIKIKGGTPANFLDVGGSANASQITRAFELLTADPRVKAILVNIFGGIMKCDVIAEGIIEAAKTIELKVPLVVRLEGTNVARGKELMASSGLPIISADDLDDAATKAVAAIQ